MKILALDTSTMMASLALLEEEELLGEYSLNQNESHSEALIPMLSDLMKNLRTEPEEIGLYAVAIGPGSFTGLRIGLATMKALAQLFDKPLIGISTLKAMAYNVGGEYVVPLLDARRNRAYSAIYQPERDEVLLPDDAYEIAVLAEKLKALSDVTICGLGAPVFHEQLEALLERKVWIARSNLHSCRASGIGLLALEDHRRGILGDYMTMTPAYLRESQAEREWKAKGGQV